MKQKQITNLTSILDQQKAEILKSINCVNIGEIQSFDSSEQTATIQIQIKKIVSTDDSGKTTLQSKPLLLQCPVMVLSGGTSYVSMPVVKGDTCIVVFNDRDIDNWFFDGGEKAPNSTRLHDLSDGFAIVGIRNLQNAITDYLANGVRIKMDDTTKIDMTANLVESLAALWFHTGSMIVTGGLQIGGTVSAYTDAGGSNEINIDTGVVKVTGDVSDTNATTPTMADIRTAYNGHTHPSGGVPSPQM